MQTSVDDDCPISLPASIDCRCSRELLTWNEDLQIRLHLTSERKLSVRIICRNLIGQGNVTRGGVRGVDVMLLGSLAREYTVFTLVEAI
jgi:hypothetical protein